MAGIRRNHQYMKKLIPLLLISVLFLVLIGCSSDEKNAIGIWKTEIDCTSDAVNNADEWISAAFMSEEINLYDYMDEYHVDAYLKLNSDGTYIAYVDENSYNAADAAVKEDIKSAFCALLNKRLEAAGKSTVTEEDMEQIFADTLGMSFDEYYTVYGQPCILSFENMSAVYDNAGLYSFKDDGICFDDCIYDYLMDEDDLCITGTVSGNMFANLPVYYHKIDSESISSAEANEVAQ